MSRINWESPEVEIALEKAKTAYEQAPYREKHRAVEKEFAKYTGVWRSFGIIRQRMVEKEMWTGGTNRCQKSQK